MATPCYVPGWRFALALSATALPVSFPAIPVLDVEAVLARLPAEARARVAWAKKPIEDALARLRTEPLTDELVAAVAEDVFKPIVSLCQTLGEIVVTNLDEWRAKLVGDLRSEEEQLGSFVEDEDSRDTLRWVLGFLQSFSGLVFSVSPEFRARVDETWLAEVEADESFKPYLRGGVALMGAVETRRASGDPQRARDLLDVAFLGMNKFRTSLRKHGVNLTPFPQESVEERHRRLLDSAHRLRNALSDDDWRVLEQARMHDLR